MDKVTIIVGDDELGTGEKSESTIDQYNRRHENAVHVNESDLIGGDFREFERHLRRVIGSTSYAWTYRENRTGRHQRTYFFNKFVALEPFELTPGTPSGVAALVGKDPYTDPGDINYLIKGDRFRAERSIGNSGRGRKEVVYGTAAMDGHAISPNYGWLVYEEQGDQRVADAKRKAYGPESEHQYINVRFDHREPGYYDAAVRADRNGKGYVPQGPGWPNEGLNLSEGWKIYVLPEVAKRKNTVLRTAKLAREKAEKVAAVQAATRKVEDAKRALATAERALQNLG